MQGRMYTCFVCAHTSMLVDEILLLECDVTDRLKHRLANAPFRREPNAADQP